MPKTGQNIQKGPLNTIIRVKRTMDDSSPPKGNITGKKTKKKDHQLTGYANISFDPAKECMHRCIVARQYYIYV